MTTQILGYMADPTEEERIKRIGVKTENKDYNKD